MATSVKNNFLNHALASNLQQALIRMKDSVQEQHQSKAKEPTKASSKPAVLVTNGEGIDSPGLTFLVEALLRDAVLDVHVCAPQSDRSLCGHSVTTGETLAVCSTQVGGANAFEVSGTPADCVSLALSGALFSWSKPVLVISGVNKGATCGYDTLYSGAVAGAREAMICGVPSLCISLNWEKNVSCESDLKDAVTVCLPLIHAAISDIQKGIFPKNCFLNIGIPSCPLTNKGVKVTRQSPNRASLNWQAVSTNRNPSAGHYMSNQQSLGIMLAKLGRDASAAAAARRLNSNRKNVEIESIGVAGKFSSQQSIKKYFRMELTEKRQENKEDDLDSRALEEGYVTVTPLSVYEYGDMEIQSSVSSWLATGVSGDQ
ncbi:5'-nucleotidase SurE-like [Vigna umbellata]|uniref:5'-nucleotidase SurE-like n=1 Tax=Vigna umbellata TaxID=87088 RepID=UPI001F5EBCA4|nr:5'-nucleotidase SurE-like [Vigna umbellata]